MELILLLGILVVGGMVAGAVALVLLPLLLVFKLIGFGLRLAFGAVGLLLGSVLVLPIAAVVGGVLLLKLLVLALPLLLFAAFVWLVITLTRRPATA